jgi:hypothetical protein
VGWLHARLALTYYSRYSCQLMIESYWKSSTLEDMTGTTVFSYSKYKAPLLVVSLVFREKEASRIHTLTMGSCTLTQVGPIFS